MKSNHHCRHFNFPPPTRSKTIGQKERRRFQGIRSLSSTLFVAAICCAIALVFSGCEDPPANAPPQGPPKPAGASGTAPAVPMPGAQPNQQSKEPYLTALISATNLNPEQDETKSIFSVVKRRAKDCGTNAECTEQTTKDLMLFSNEEFASLISLINGDGEIALRLEAIRVLSMRQIQKAVPALITGLQDARREIVLECIRGLGDIREPSSLETLISMTIKKHPTEYRAAAIFSIGCMGTDEAVNALSAATAEASPEEMQWIIGALGQTKHPKSIQILEGAATNTDPGVRIEAVIALANMGHRARVMAILKSRSIHEKDANVRSVALQSLHELQKKPSLDHPAPTPAPEAPAPEAPAPEAPAPEAPTPG